MNKEDAFVEEARQVAANMLDSFGMCYATLFTAETLIQLAWLDSGRTEAERDDALWAEVGDAVDRMKETLNADPIPTNLAKLLAIVCLLTDVARTMPVGKKKDP